MKRIFLTILFLLIACNAMAATYYVKTGGDDTAAGTSDGTAWAHCPGMVGWTGSATLSSGDTVYLNNQHTWSGLAPVLSASAGVTYDGTSYGAGTVGVDRAIITPTGYQVDGYQASSRGIVHIIQSNVVFRGIEVDGGAIYPGDGIQISGYRCNYDISDILIDNCYVHNVHSSEWNNGISVSPRRDTTGRKVSRLTFKNTTVTDTDNASLSLYPAWDGDEPSGNSLEDVLVQNCTFSYDTIIGINIKSDVKNVTVEYCNIHHNGIIPPNTGTVGTGIGVETSTYDPYVAPQNLIIRNNLIYNNGQRGISFKNKKPLTWDGVHIYNNIVWDNCLTDIVGTYTTQSTKSASNLEFGADDYANSLFYIYNNVFYMNKAVSLALYTRNINIGTGSSSGGAVTGSPLIDFKNNIVYFSDCSSYQNLTDVGQKLTHSNNLIYCGAGKYWVNSGSLTFYDDGTYYTSVNAGWEATAQVTDPTFTGGDLPTGFSGTYGTDLIPNQTYFSLQAGSPALNNGAVLASTYSKAINNAGTDSTYTRGTSWWDIGAYEATLTGGATITNTGAIFSGMTF